MSVVGSFGVGSEVVQGAQLVMAPKSKLALLTIQDGDNVLAAINDNFRRIEEFLAPFGGNHPTFYQLARFLGGLYVEGDIEKDSDTRFENKLGRIPTAAILSVDLNGTQGSVDSTAAGTGYNQTAWSLTEVFLRATVASKYAVILL